jgi:hypothetical protein
MVVILAMDVRPRAVTLMLTFFINIMLLSLSVVWCSYNQSSSIICSYTPITTPVLLGVITVFAGNVSVILTSRFRSVKFSQVSREESYLLFQVLIFLLPVHNILLLYFFFTLSFIASLPLLRRNIAKCFQKLGRWICVAYCCLWVQNLMFDSHCF